MSDETTADAAAQAMVGKRFEGDFATGPVAGVVIAASADGLTILLDDGREGTVSWGW